MGGNAMAGPTDVLRQLFLVLCQEQNDSWIQPRPGRGPTEQALHTYQRLISVWPPLTEQDIEREWQKSSGVFDLDLSKDRKVLYLRPVREEPLFVPVLTLAYHFGNNRTEAKLRVVFVKGDTSGTRLYCIGFRLELGTGQHSYAHAQLIETLHGASSEQASPCARSPVDLPEEQPALPLPANCPVTLLLCLLWSLYGMGYCRSLSAENRVSDLGTYLRRLDDWLHETGKKRRR
jgi:hypothetical protein